MGLFKQVKDMKSMVAAAPAMLDQAQQLQAHGMQLQAAQQAALGDPGAPIAGGQLDPIAGISLEEYARIAKTIGERRLDQAGIEALVQGLGHTPEAWQAAYDGWNARFKGDMALSVRFGTIYQTTQGY